VAPAVLAEVFMPWGNRVAVSDMVGNPIEFEILLLFGLCKDLSIVDISVDFIGIAGSLFQRCYQTHH
jgi:hypothetical protein